ncbi:GNAT family N-acetyltransferase [Paenibacillus sp. BC26]|uniref:GNAT family N-acetyltransferase n=1 Tax=Paenibacillus sp. BC26 TaxID=1881032 RepID=UPI0008E4C0B2|nr:GNAT family N-acetyltransferase [Paenibacillus sp. BC26]SFS75176.1 diamine N-acetyltransferase [Paenibacillus sp. BC26]
MITIHEVDRSNWFACTQLQISEENGQRFIVPIVYSIAESKYENHLKPVAICKNDTVIGFGMYCRDQDDGRYWIYVFMIDENYQGQGYGKSGLKQLLKHIKETEDIEDIQIGHKPDNEKAGYLYESVGFKQNGQIINGEIVRTYRY